MEHHQVAVNGIELHVVQDGPSSGPLVILLHGFPEFWYGWHEYIPYLAGAGYRVLAPDQRGYNLSDKPEGISSYTLDKLVDDIIGLIDATGREKAFFIGHDWGAALTWWIAANHPERVAGAVPINCPHWEVFLKHLRRNPKQMLRSWYILFFQIPWVPDTFTKLGGWAAQANALKRSSRPGTFTEEDLSLYRQAWSQPGAYKSMLNWYRAFVQQRPASPVNSRVSVPTLLIWGARDKFLGKEMAQPSIDLCNDGRLVIIDETTHWVQHEEPDQVNELIYSFLRNNFNNQAGEHEQDRTAS